MTHARLMHDSRFADLGTARRIFAVPSIHGHLNELTHLHYQIADQFQSGDRLLYLGNYTGYGPYSRQVIDSILAFRRYILSKPGMIPSDIVYLRGVQEEMWQKLLQLQFAPNPSCVLGWMLRKGMAETLESYEIDPEDALAAARGGTLRLARWTDHLRCHVKGFPGHDLFTSQFKRAAYTRSACASENGLLFVNAGLDGSKPLTDQGDMLWWGHDHFKALCTPYQGYARVFRGYDPSCKGFQETPWTTTLDHLSAKDGQLICAAIAPDGRLQQLLTA